jgi:hypothetical protein
MTARTSAFLLRLFGIVAAILLAAFAGFGPSVLAKDTPGNNGTVKIHDGADENANGEVRNEPHVCTFHLHFYFADPVQSGSWEIQEWAPTGTKGTVVMSGTYDTAGDGEDRQPETGAYELDPGHYKLFWDGDTGKHDKMKVFWVECAPAETGGGNTGGSGGTGGTGGTGGSGGTGGTGGTGNTGGTGGTGGTGTGKTGGTGGTGQELGESGTGGTGGGVLGVTATPPATDTTNLAAESEPGNNWVPVLLVLGALVAVTISVTPTRVPSRLSRAVRSRRS